MYKYIILSIIIINVFNGCKTNKNAPQYTSKEFKNINKDIVLNATKKVVLLADNRFSIQSNLNSIEATRFTPKFNGYNIDLEINKISMEASMDGNTTIAKLFITQKKDYLDKEEKIITSGTHDLIWERINYILGINDKWPSCYDNIIKLNFDGSVCDKIYNKNTKPNKNDIMKNINIMKSKKTILDHKKIKVKEINLSPLDKINLPNAKSKMKNENLEKIKPKLPVNKIPYNNSTAVIKEINLEEINDIKN